MPDNKKSFREHQVDSNLSTPPGSLAHKILSYVPDADQVSSWLTATLGFDKPPENRDGKARRGLTRGNTR